MSAKTGKEARHAPRHDHHQEVTDRIIAALEAGTRPWQRPWRVDKVPGATMPVSGATGRHYHGINLLLLTMSAFAVGTDDPRWCTYKQAADRGWQVRRGERGTTVFFYKKLVVDQPESDPEQHGTKTIPLLRAFTVFHASQIDGIPSLEPPVPPEPVFKRIEAVETILRNSQIEVRIGGSRAFYCPSTDHIQMPADSCFDSAESRAAVLLHEVGHSSGAKHRLNRDLSGSFGSESYAREEIRAEIFSCTIGATLGLPTDIPNHASYIHSWIRVLKHDKREIFRAAADAQRITDYCLRFHPDYQDDTGQDEQDSSPSDNDAFPAAA